MFSVPDFPDWLSYFFLALGAVCLVPFIDDFISWRSD